MSAVNRHQTGRKRVTIMAEEKKNAQVINGVNDDIAELKSLSTLRQRVVSDGEIVSKSANGFRLANGNTGVMLRNDGRDFLCADDAGRPGAKRAVEHPAPVLIQFGVWPGCDAKRCGYLWWRNGIA
jgi:hypothetical protein